MKSLVLLAVSLAALSCGNNKTTEAQPSPVTTATDNVDGNVPDSTNSINLNRPLPTDSSGLNDSTPR